MNNSVTFVGAVFAKKGINLKKSINQSNGLVKPPKKVQNSKKALVEKSLTALNLDPKDYVAKSKKGVVSVFDKSGKRVAKISPEGKYGISFVFVEPRTVDESPLRYAIDKNGEIIFQYKSLSGIEQFRKNFSQAVKFSKQ